jgi:hypothetical protein
LKYVILVYSNPRLLRMWEGMTEEQKAEGRRGHTAARDAMLAAGELVISEALADPSLTKRLGTDGPFAEVKEHLAGFYLVDCENIDRAMEHAGRLPESSFGLVEVRPVLERMP